MFPLALASGVAVGYARGGRLRNVSVPGKGASFLFAALVPQAIVLSSSVAEFILLAASYALVGGYLIWFLLSRRRLQSVLVTAALAFMLAGWAMNSLVIALNDGMPAGRAAFAAASGSGEQIDRRIRQTGPLVKHVPETSHTRLRQLGDVIRVPIRSLVPVPGKYAVASVGDFVLLFGIALLVAGAMNSGVELARRRPSARRPA